MKYNNSESIREQQKFNNSLSNKIALVLNNFISFFYPWKRLSISIETFVS